MLLFDLLLSKSTLLTSSYVYGALLTALFAVYIAVH